MKSNYWEDITIEQAIEYVSQKYNLDDIYSNPGYNVLNQLENNRDIAYRNVGRPELFIYNSIEHLRQSISSLTQDYRNNRERKEIVNYIIEGLPMLAEYLCSHKNFGGFQSTPASMIYSINQYGGIIAKAVSACSYNVPIRWNLIKAELSGGIYIRQLILEKNGSKLIKKDVGLNHIIEDDGVTFYPYAMASPLVAHVMNQNDQNEHRVGYCLRLSKVKFDDGYEAVRNYEELNVNGAGDFMI